MEVSVDSFLAAPSEWLDRVRAGEEIVILDRGTPVARLLSVDNSALLEQLTEQGVLSRAELAARPAARSIRRVRPMEPVSELIERQRR